MKPIKQFKIPFDKDGNMVIWGGYGVHEEDNHIFTDRLEYSNYCGNHIGFKSLNTGRLYWMFISHFHELLLEKKMIDNIVEGEFYFIRKGTKPGLKLILPDKPKKIRTP
jgi:hypothetical protein